MIVTHWDKKSSPHRLFLSMSLSSRLYHCHRCHAQVIICSRCDRGVSAIVPANVTALPEPNRVDAPLKNTSQLGRDGSTTLSDNNVFERKTNKK